MKKNYYFILIFLAVFAVSCEPSAEEAKAYCEKIAKQTKLVDDKISELIQSYDTYNGEIIDKAFDNAVSQISETTKLLEDMSSLNGDKSLKENALKLTKTAKNVLEKEHSELVRLSKIPENEYSDTHVKIWDANMNAAKNKLANAQKDFEKHVKSFEKKFKIK